MLDTPKTSRLGRGPGDTPQLPAMQRVRGTARAGFIARDGKTYLSDLHQAGSGKAMLPRVSGTAPEVVFLNTAGGLTGGDVLTLGLVAGPGAQVTGTTQTAERAYASAGGRAKVAVTLQAGAGARLDWLPQETLLFDRSALARETVLTLGAGAEALMVETLCFGRRAMGEVVRSCDLTDRREVWREGRLIWREPLYVAGTDNFRSAARFAEMRAVSTLVLFAQGAEDRVEALRACLDGHDGVEAGVSGWDGKVVVRLGAPDLWPLRRALIDVMIQVRGQVPRVWQM